MRYCKNCGAELNENAAVCTKCGVLVGDGNKFCPNCGAEPDPLAAICVKCGYELKPIKRNTISNNKRESASWTHPHSEDNGECSCKTEYHASHQGNDFAWAVKTCFAKYSTFSGRARRKEFWYWYLFTCLTTIAGFLLSCLLALISAAMGAAEIFVILNGIWSLIIFLPNLAVTVRRLHDVGHSGWYYLIAIIPVIGVILLLVALCTDSVDDNKYGINPKVKKHSNLQ